VQVRHSQRTGIVGATVVTMGLLALPTMLRRNDPVATGNPRSRHRQILGQTHPPSIVLVLLGMMPSAYSQAQLKMGIFSPKPCRWVIYLSVGALIPGLPLVSTYILYIIIGVAILQPNSCRSAGRTGPD
jgi:TRAP-type mannitol/chloroaromatic compound transport system permease large subunit